MVGFGSNDFDIFALGNELTERGWNLNSLQYPSGYGHDFNFYNGLSINVDLTGYGCPIS